MRCFCAAQVGKGWQGASLLQHRRKSSAELGQDGTAHGSVLGRSQRPTGAGLAQELRGVRRRSAERVHSESVSRRPGNSPRCGGRTAGETERTGAAAGSRVRQLLAGVRAVASVEPGWFLATTTAGRTRSGELGEGVAVAGGESVDRSGQRVAVTSAMVSGQRHGRIAGSRFCGGRERPAVSLSGSDLGAQAGTVRLAAAEVGRFVSCRLRGAALRLYVQRKADVFSGNRPTRGKVRTL